MQPIFIESVLENHTDIPLNPAEFQAIRNSQFTNFSSIDQLVSEYQKSCPGKIELSKFLANHLKDHQVQSMISFGSGESVIEYLIKRYHGSIEICVSDFDESMIDYCKSIYRDTFREYLKIDISKDGLDFLANKFQLALVNAVIYALDNQKATQFFRNLALANIKYVLVVHTAQLFVLNQLKRLAKGLLKSEAPKRENTFWGWSRYKREIVSVARSAGYRLTNYYVTDFGGKRAIYLFKLGYKAERSGSWLKKSL